MRLEWDGVHWGGTWGNALESVAKDLLDDGPAAVTAVYIGDDNRTEVTLTALLTGAGDGIIDLSVEHSTLMLATWRVLSLEF